MSPAGRDPARLILIGLLLLALLPRLAAVSFNAWPHGDVLLDAAVADSLVERGELEVPLVDIRFYPVGRFGFGYPPDQHPPLWPLLGAALRLAWPDSYEALKLLSLIFGLLLILAVYRCGRDLFGTAPALFAAATCAVSYLLIDFSGNGSLWSLLALLYVVFAWRAGCCPWSGWRESIVLGLIMGAAYLTNYPAVVLPVTLVLLVVLARRGPTSPDATWPDSSPPGQPAIALAPSAASAVRTLAVAAALVLPWLIFNLATFGNPVWSQPLARQLGGGDKQVEVVIQDGEVVKRYLPPADPLGERLRTTASNLYGNVGFVVRQSFVLAPFLGGFALVGLVVLGLALYRGTAGRRAPLVLLTLAHLALILLWPTTKFRYLVPLFPLLVLIGSWLLFSLKPAELRNLLAAAAFGLACFTSAWTFASVPSHTYYYDGGVVGDNFGGQGEIAYVTELRQLERAAAAIRAAGPGAVLGPHPLYHLTRQPLVVNSAAFNREVVEHLVRRYNIRYLVAEPGRAASYTSFLPGQIIWQDETLAVYRTE